MLDLPVREALPALRAALRDSRTAILTAPPGAGKSTLVPQALLDEPWMRDRSIVMLQPRRVAARAIAARIAAALGEALGETVGYQVRLERVGSPRTRIDVVTEGILTRRIQSDPTLADVGLIIFDEFHERSLHADLALALARRVQAALRDDLRLLIMSATLDADAISRSLGDAAPVATSTGRTFPVDVSYATTDVSIEQDPAPAVASAVRRSIGQTRGDVLAFLPGGAEIRRTQSILTDSRGAQDDAFDVVPLYGDLPFDAQQRALIRGSRRRVVLATNIAETSLTIEGVTAVVDSGLVRVARFSPSRGTSRLQTVRVSRANATQRAGRAGRLGPGMCLRLWTEITHRTLAETMPPEIEHADLTPLALDLAAWGEPDDAIQWMTAPNPGALQQARNLLRQLGALPEAGESLTAHGEELLSVGLHPRIGHLLIGGARVGQAEIAAKLAALLDSGDYRASDGADLTRAIEALTDGRDGHSARLREAAAVFERRVRHVAKGSAAFGGSPFLSEGDVGSLVALAFPERVAKRRAASRLSYVMASGRGARLKEGDALGSHEWLAIAHVDDGTGRHTESQIRLAAPVNPHALPEGAVTDRRYVAWDRDAQRVVARRERRVGELTVDSHDLVDIDETERHSALLGAVRSEGLALLGLPNKNASAGAFNSLRARITALRTWGRADFSDVDETALMSRLDEWLQPALGSARSRDDLERIDLAIALRSTMDWKRLQLVDAWAPETLTVPTGSSLRLDYASCVDGSGPVLRVRLQEVFGWTETPTVNDGRTQIVLHLLSPGYKPVQVTKDLRSFWARAYVDVRKELRARYPKHSWPEDPHTAIPIRGPKKRQ